jgi:hypothetical protein
MFTSDEVINTIVTDECLGEVRFPVLLKPLLGDDIPGV